MLKLKFNGVNIALLVVAVATVWVTFNFFIEFSGFAVVIAKASIGLTLAAVVDNVILRAFNTVEEIKNGNVTYATVYFGFMFIIGLALLSG